MLLSSLMICRSALGPSTPTKGFPDSFGLPGLCLRDGLTMDFAQVVAVVIGTGKALFAHPTTPTVFAIYEVLFSIVLSPDMALQVGGTLESAFGRAIGPETRILSRIPGFRLVLVRNMCENSEREEHGLSPRP